MFSYLSFSEGLYCTWPDSKVKKLFLYFFLSYHPPTPQKRPEDGVSTKRSIVDGLRDRSLFMAGAWGGESESKVEGASKIF